MGELNKQKSVLADEKRQLEAKVSSLEQEITALQASVASKSSAPPPSPAPASVSSEETQKLNALIVSNLSIT
jgi:nucleoprotein TPR